MKSKTTYIIRILIPLLVVTVTMWKLNIVLFWCLTFVVTEAFAKLLSNKKPDTVKDRIGFGIYYLIYGIEYVCHFFYLIFKGVSVLECKTRAKSNVCFEQSSDNEYEWIEFLFDKTR